MEVTNGKKPNNYFSVAPRSSFYPYWARLYYYIVYMDFSPMWFLEGSFPSILGWITLQVRFLRSMTNFNSIFCKIRRFYTKSRYKHVLFCLFFFFYNNSSHEGKNSQDTTTCRGCSEMGTQEFVYEPLKHILEIGWWGKNWFGKGVRKFLKLLLETLRTETLKKWSFLGL